MNIDWLHTVLIAVIAVLTTALFKQTPSASTVSSVDTSSTKQHVNGEVTSQSKISASQILDFLLIVGQLKTQKRTGWVNHNIELPESISDHMYRMAVMGLIVQTPGLDRHRLSLVSLSHDLAEAVVGDITPTRHSGVSKEDKHRMEVEGLQKMLSLLNNDVSVRNDVETLWNEYEEQSSEEGRAAKELDKLEMLVQAYEYERDQRVVLTDFYKSSEKYMKSTWARELFDEIMHRREVMKKEWEEKGVQPRVPSRSQ